MPLLKSCSVSSTEKAGQETHSFRQSSAPFTCLNVLLELQEGRVHDVPEAEVLAVHLEGSADDLRDALPMTGLHGLVGHELKQRTHVVEVVYRLLEGVEGWPLLQPLRKLAASREMYEHMSVASSDIYYIYIVFVFCMNEDRPRPQALLQRHISVSSLNIYYTHILLLSL